MGAGIIHSRKHMFKAVSRCMLSLAICTQLQWLVAFFPAVDVVSGRLHAQMALDALKLQQSRLSTRHSTRICNMQVTI